MLKQCCIRTRKGKLCPINADREHDGQFYCHVHDPEGVFARQSRGEAVPGHVTPPARSKRVKRKRAARNDAYSAWLLNTAMNAAMGAGGANRRAEAIRAQKIEARSLTRNTKPRPKPQTPPPQFTSREEIMAQHAEFDRELTDSLQAD